jgi:hypothetical protein
MSRATALAATLAALVAFGTPAFAEDVPPGDPAPAPTTPPSEYIPIEPSEPLIYPPTSNPEGVYDINDPGPPAPPAPTVVGPELTDAEREAQYRAFMASIMLSDATFSQMLEYGTAHPGSSVEAWRDASGAVFMRASGPTGWIMLSGGAAGAQADPQASGFRPGGPALGGSPLRQATPLTTEIRFAVTNHSPVTSNVTVSWQSGTALVARRMIISAGATVESNLILPAEQEQTPAGGFLIGRSTQTSVRDGRNTFEDDAIALFASASPQAPLAPAATRLAGMSEPL